MSHPMEAAFADEPAFIPYLAAGDAGPFDAITTPEDAIRVTHQYVEALVDGGADIIELGLPFSEPIADGPTIRGATTRALENGMTPVRYLELVADLAVDVPIVCMTYYNPIYRFGGTAGVKDFVTAAADAGIDGLIVPDLPVEESGNLRRACEVNGIAVIFIAAPTTSTERLARILEVGTGYLYVQARLGTTGARADISGQTATSLARINTFEKEHEARPIPKAVGFGIATGDQAADVVEAGADGVIVGSALVDQISASQSPDDAVETLRTAAAELKAGARRGMETRTDGPQPK